MRFGALKTAFVLMQMYRKCSIIMLCFQKTSARTVAHVVALLSMLPCLSVASCCCAMGNMECSKTSTACYLNRSLSSCGHVAWSCISNSNTRCLNGGQNSTECACNRPCCCCNSPHKCNGMLSGISCNWRKKPAGATSQWHSRISIGQGSPPISRIVGLISWAPSITSTSARCSQLCRFLL
jgi:hypothetical protein